MATSGFFCVEFDDIVEVCWPTLIKSSVHHGGNLERKERSGICSCVAYFCVRCVRCVRCFRWKSGSLHLLRSKKPVVGSRLRESLEQRR